MHGGRWLLLAAALVAWIPGVGNAADAPKSLRDILTPEEFRRAGLQKLTEAELDFLNRILPARMAALEPHSVHHHSAGPAPHPPTPIAKKATEPVVGEAAFGREARLQETVEKRRHIPDRIASRLMGAFRGWTGRTVFRLENGQVWQQTDGSRFSVNLMNPTVVIRKGLFGVFYLNVKGYGSSAKVKRLH